MLNEETLKFIRDHRFDDVRKLALSAPHSLNPSSINISWALTQIRGRQFAENKIPSWYQLDQIIYPPHLALEQCSSEQTARYKAGLLTGHSFADLTGGFGVDFAFISGKFKESFYVEKQKELCEIAAFNFNVLGLKFTWIIHDDVTNFLGKMSPVDTIFIDPGRHLASGKRVFSIEESEPDLLQIQDLLLEKSKNVLVKLSPMLDISQALKQLKHVAEVHVVSLENECKELLFLIKKDYTLGPLITCVNLSKKNHSEISFLLSQEKANQIKYTSEIEQYIYEPNTSLLKGGFFKGLTDLYPLKKFHPDSHLYTSALFIPDFPGRIFQTESYTTCNKNELRKFLYEIKKASITIRNFPLSVADLRRRIRVKEGGDIQIFATTLANGKPVLIKTRKAG